MGDKEGGGSMRGRMRSKRSGGRSAAEEEDKGEEEERINVEKSKKTRKQE